MTNTDTQADFAAGLAVEQNLFSLFRAMAALPGGRISESPSLSWHMARPGNPMFKGAWRTALEEPGVDEAIDETLARFEESRAPFMFWWTGPTTSPADLGRRLQARGLLSIEGQARDLAAGIKSGQSGAPGMAADLLTADLSALDKVEEGFEVAEVYSEDDLTGFHEVLVRGYQIPALFASAWVDAAHDAGIGRTPWKMYLGRHKGRPVATSMVFDGAGVTGVYGVATVPEARRRGFGAAVTLLPLMEAKSRGVTTAVLFGADMALGVYKRIGFRELPVRINRFLWRAPD